MLSSVTLQDATGTPIALHTDTPASTALLKTARGLVGIGPVRSSVRVRPQAHGGINETKWQDGQIVTLEGEVWSTIDVPTAMASFRAITKPMLQTLDNGPALLQWTEGVAGLQLQKTVVLNGDVEPILSEGAALLMWQAQFYAADPRSYSQAATVATSSNLSASSGGRVIPTIYPYHYAQSSGGTVTVTNNGNRPTPLLWNLNGQMTNPQIVLLDGTNRRVALLGSVAAGSYLQVDTYARTIALNGSATSLLPNYVDPVNTTWLEAPIGVSNWQVVAGSFDANAFASVSFRHAYA